MNRVGKAITVTVILSAVAIGVSGRYPARIREAPDVAFTTITGEKIALRQWRGHPVLVTFWASDCRSCIEEMPLLSQLHRDYGAKGLKIIAIAMDYDPPNHVLATVTRESLPYPVALDPLAKLAKAFDDVRLVPSNFLFAPDGSLAVHRLGLLDPQWLRASIERMLSETLT
jgi:thiol-disulfide isomerase/thioredoxin